jgi:Peptidase family M41
MTSEKILTPSVHLFKQADPGAVQNFNWLSNSAIAQWASDLERMSPPEPLYDWSLVGRGVLVEHFDLEVIESIAAAVANKAKFRFQCLGHDDLMCLEKQLNTSGIDHPTVIYLPPGPWQGGKEGDTGDSWGDEGAGYNEAACYRIRAQITEFLRSDPTKCPAIVVTGVRKHTQINVGLRRLGLFDRRIRVPELDPAYIADDFIRFVGGDLLDDTIIKDKLCFGILLGREFPTRRRRSLLKAAIRRRAWQQGSPIGLQEVVQMAAHGTQDDPNPSSELENEYKLMRHAVHEAGHAVVAYYESAERKFPIYCSIIKRNESLGILMAAPDAVEHNEEDPSFSDMIYRIKVCLAGRAAEHVMLGQHQVSARGASSDLEQASELSRALFAQWGYSPERSDINQVGLNLLIIDDESPDVQKNRVEEECRNLLNQLYLQVFGLLQKHRVVIERIADALVERRSLFAKDFKTLLQT